jgi:thiamine kinase-like enzyme
LTDDAIARIAALPCWQGPVAPAPLAGGITNTNFLVEDRDARFFVRVGADIPAHGVLRFNELAACRAAEAAGVSPAVRHAAPGVLVLDWIEGRTLTPADVRADLGRVVALVRRAHREIPRHLRGPALVFWVFHVIHDYAHTLAEAGARLAAELPGWLASAARLEQAVGPVELVYGHNDLLAANLIDDGQRLWLVDWDYAGFNSPLFDLGGLASNNELDETTTDALLTAYFGRPPDAHLRYRLAAMKCASLLRESMWSMVSELHSTLDFDYVAYTAENLARYERALAAFEALRP